MMSRKEEFIGGWEQNLQRENAMFDAVDRGKFDFVDSPGCSSGSGGKSCRSEGFICAGCTHTNLQRFEGRK